MFRENTCIYVLPMTLLPMTARLRDSEPGFFMVLNRRARVDNLWTTLSDFKSL